MTAAEANKEIDNLMSQGYGTIVIKNPQGKHSLGVGILNKLNLIFEGSLGYFGMGSCDGPIVKNQWKSWLVLCRKFNGR